MCVIIHKPEDALLGEDILRMCWNANNNGAGFMYATNNELIVKRGYMKFKNFYKSYKSVEDKNMVIHFRWASCGEVSATACHPFKLSQNVAMVHNGHVNIPYCMEEKESDSLWLVKNIFKKFPENFIDRQEYIKIISMAVKGSVLVFMNNTGKIVKIGEYGSLGDVGIYVNGCWFSNNFWMTEGVKIII